MPIYARSWPEDPPLGRWLNKQREFKRALDHGELNPEITAAQVAKLDALSFA